jgi:hypothetical protein
MTGGGDGNGAAVSNGNMTINWAWRKKVKDTDVLGEVGVGDGVAGVGKSRVGDGARRSAA